MPSKEAKIFIERFSDILDELDAVNGDDDLDELNAQLEDSIFMLESLDADEADEMSDTFDEMEELSNEYHEYASEHPEIKPCADTLAMAIQMARANLCK